MTPLPVGSFFVPKKLVESIRLGLLTFLNEALYNFSSLTSTLYKTTITKSLMELLDIPYGSCEHGDQGLVDYCHEPIAKTNGSKVIP